MKNMILAAMVLGLMACGFEPQEFDEAEESAPFELIENEAPDSSIRILVCGEFHLKHWCAVGRGCMFMLCTGGKEAGPVECEEIDEARYDALNMCED